MRQLLLALPLLLLSCCSPVKPDSRRLTTDNILKLKLGMTTNDVETLLGEPLETVHHIEATGNDCGDTLFAYTYRYTEKPQSHGDYAMLWIHFTSRKKVNEVYVKEKSFDERGIYLLSAEPCNLFQPRYPTDSAAAKEELKNYFW